MNQFIKYSIILLILIWSVTYRAKGEQGSAIYTVSNGRLIPIKNTSAYSDQYYGRNTNSKVFFTKIIKDRYGNEIK